MCDATPACHIDRCPRVGPFSRPSVRGFVHIARSFGHTPLLPPSVWFDSGVDGEGEEEEGRTMGRNWLRLAGAHYSPGEGLWGG